jgi:hypothetical protein
VATRTEAALAALLPMETEPLAFEPDGLKAAVELLEAELEESRNGQGRPVAEVEPELEEARKGLAEATFRFKFRHVPTGTHNRIKDQAKKVRTDWISGKTGVDRDGIRAELLSDIDSESDESVVSYVLEIMGKGESYTNDSALSTIGDLIRQSVDRIRAEQGTIDTFCGETAQGLCSALLEALEYEAANVDDDDWIKGFKVYPTEQEQTEIADADEDAPDYDEQVVKKRHKVFARHLKIERDKRKKEVEEMKAVLEKRGRESLIRELVNMVLRKRADYEESTFYIQTMIAEMALEEDDGKWVKAFGGRDRVAELETRFPDLYEFLTIAVASLLPKGVSELIAARSFRGDVLYLPCG